MANIIHITDLRCYCSCAIQLKRFLEIEYQELEIEASQRKIKHFTAELEARLQDKASTTKAIEERTVDLNQKRSELDQILAETKAETEALMLKAAELSKKIDERLLTAFNRIRKNAHNGLAVVKVERDSCGGCHMLKAQGYNLPDNVPSNEFLNLEGA